MRCISCCVFLCSPSLCCAIRVVVCLFLTLFSTVLFYVVLYCVVRFFLVFSCAVLLVFWVIYTVFPELFCLCCTACSFVFCCTVLPVFCVLLCFYRVVRCRAILCVTLYRVLLCCAAELHDVCPRFHFVQLCCSIKF